MARLAESSPSSAAPRAHIAGGAGAGVARGGSGSRLPASTGAVRCSSERRRSRGRRTGSGAARERPEAAGSAALPVRRRCGPGGGRGKAGAMAAPVGPEPAGGPAAEEIGGAGREVASLEHVRVDVAVADDLDGDMPGSSLPRSWARPPVAVSRGEVFGAGGCCMVRLSPSSSRRGVGCACGAIARGVRDRRAVGERRVFGGAARRSGGAVVLRAGFGPGAARRA